MPPEPEFYARLHHYDAWANAETLASLRQSGGPPKALRWMAHIVGSSALWLARVREEPPAMAVWPELDVDECAAELERLAQAWPRYLAELESEDLAEEVGYRNSKGEVWSSRVSDILMHLTLHGSYHRAQIAAAVRENGHEPAYTDFIHAVRQGHIE